MIHVPMQPCRLCACLLAVRLQVLDRFSNCEFTCEFKYDGERAQIHLLADGSVKIFSRNSEVSGTLDPGKASCVGRLDLLPPEAFHPICAGQYD